MGCFFPSTTFMTALFDYEAIQGNQINLKKGDRCKLLDEINNDWCRIKNLNSKQNGMVPYTFVAKEKTADAEDWFFANICRKEAEELLLSDKSTKGVFLVRQSENQQHPYSLSIKDESEGIFHIKHCKIKYENLLFFYGPNHKYKSLRELVDYYKKASISRSSFLILTEPCAKRKPPVYYEWEINKRDIKLYKKIGEGNFGEVYYGFWHKTEVAVKTLKPNTMTISEFLSEADLMKFIRHPKMVSLYGVCTKSEPIFIVQEYMPNGSLLQFLRDSSFLKLNDLVFFAAQVADGMKYLEENRLIHRDLAARNVLVGHSKIVKICDFGLARALNYNDYRPRAPGEIPVKWTAPEAMRKEIYSIKSDVWSYGILLMEIFTNGDVPYPGMHIDDVREGVLNHGYRMKNPENHKIPENIFSIMSHCWEEDPNNRPTFEYLFDYFKNYDVSSERNYM